MKEKIKKKTQYKNLPKTIPDMKRIIKDKKNNLVVFVLKRPLSVRYKTDAKPLIQMASLNSFRLKYYLKDNVFNQKMTFSYIWVTSKFS